MQRVEKINANDDYLHKVSKVMIFGSYLGTKEYLGDLDVAVQLKKKIKDPTEFRFWHDELVELAVENGVTFPSFSYKYNYSYHLLSKHLKNQ